MVGQSVMHATVIISAVGGPPHSWGALLKEGFLSLNPHLTTGLFIRTVIIRWGVINGDLFIFLILVFPGCLVRAV